jgi:polyisoprenyl-phosphate glycosyltransferase
MRLEMSTYAGQDAVVLHSFVIPVFNEAQGLEPLRSRLSALFTSLAPDSAEVIFVNDGSRDGSGEILDRFHKEDPRFKVIHLSRNFGHQLAITAGLDWADGDTVIVMDADLQDPPELARELIAKWREGFEVVFAQRRRRVGETWFKLFTAKVFYRTIRRLTNVDIPLDTGDFRLMDRRAVLAFRELREQSRFVRGMVSWLGFRQTGVLYDRDERKFGETHYPLKKMIRFAIDGITSFSAIPLRIATYLGLLSALTALVLAIWTLYVRFATGLAIPGWSSVMLAVLFLGGAQLVCLGIFGEYLGRTYNEAKRRPLYFVGRTHGFKR